MSVDQFELASSIFQKDNKPAIAQLVDHLTADLCSDQMVRGLIPDVRTFFAWRSPIQNPARCYYDRISIGFLVKQKDSWKSLSA
jgi:hypothetical protein